MLIFSRTLEKISQLNMRNRVVILLLLTMLPFFALISFATRYYFINLQAEEQLQLHLKTVNAIWVREEKNLIAMTKNLVRELEDHGVNNFDSLASMTKYWPYGLEPDILFLVNQEDEVIYSLNTKIPRSKLYLLPAVQKAKLGQTVSGLETLPADFIASEYLTDQAKITEQDAKQPVPKEITTGMAQIIAVPIQIADEFRGVLVCGRLVNNDPAFVNKINELLHVPISIFMNDVRIATSLKNEKGARLVGTSIKQPLENKYLQGEPSLLKKLFSINQRYSIVYQPLKDINGTEIGSLCIGLPKEPLAEKYQSFIIALIFIFLLMLIFFRYTLDWFYRMVILPINKLLLGARSIAGGNFQFRLENRSTNQCRTLKACTAIDCPSLAVPGVPCWLIPKTSCTPKCNSAEEKKTFCESCVVFQKLSGNEITQLSDTFNYMAHNLEASLGALENSENILYTLALTVEAKDPYTRGHSERVADYSVAIGQALGLCTEDLDALKRAGILHDIGKIGVSDTILHKPSKLTKWEYAVIQEHPARGEQICANLQFAKDVLPIIRHHHEYFNGNGYPDGLSKEAIPRLARIIAVADSFDAMTSHRPYRQGMPAKVACQNLLEGSNTQWDPEIVSIFIQLYESGQINLAHQHEVKTDNTLEFKAN